MANPQTATPINNGAALIGSVMFRLTPHWTEPDVFVLQARDVRFSYPRAENVGAACAILGIAPAAAVEANAHGLYARVDVTRAEIEAGNPLAAFLAQGGEDLALAKAATLADRTSAEA